MLELVINKFTILKNFVILFFLFQHAAKKKKKNKEDIHPALEVSVYSPEVKVYTYIQIVHLINKVSLF